MRTLSYIECTAVGCTNQASVKINDDLLCAYCAHPDLPVVVDKRIGEPVDLSGFPIPLAVEVCPVHNVELGEGAPCHKCEEAMHNMLTRSAEMYIDAVVKGARIDHVSHRRRNAGQHIAYLCMTMGLYGATASQIVEVMRIRNIMGSTETVQAVLDYLN